MKSAFAELPNKILKTMIPEYRDEFNRSFSETRYEQLKEQLKEKAGTPALFRISESPVFLYSEFKNQLTDACNSIVKQILEIPQEQLRKAIPADSVVPGDTDHPNFLCIDFGICRNDRGQIVPQLIELQGFPSLYAFQYAYEETVNEIFPFTASLKTTLPKEAYIQKLRDVITGDENPENVILLEIYPEQQKTNIDFAFTEKYLGIKTVCLTQIIREGRKLFYELDGRKIPVHRIYNRVIFDELHRIPNLKPAFDFREELEVKWVTHPNWFFKISKYILPELQHTYIPKSYFLKNFPKDENPEDFVLKPLFSFAGSGVNLHPTQEIIEQIPDPENFIMQRKVQYAPVFRDINGDFSKAEIRMMYLWKDGDALPELMGNLVRMTKVDMANVDFNKKDAIWIGSSMAFFA
ncbi:hypothetical protein [Daejeonia sp. YH14]|uniref:hypothetical protein n=1 Tax=Daejeonia sp. YH14 TaxID=3439042 RepID=UPI003F493EF1